MHSLPDSLPPFQGGLRRKAITEKFIRKPADAGPHLYETYNLPGVSCLHLYNKKTVLILLIFPVYI